MQKIFLFLKGYIYIKVSGFAPERVVNLCGNRGIFLWDILVKENVYYMHMRVRDFFQIAPLVRKTKTKVVLLKRIGLPFLLPEIYKRKIFMFGFIVTVFLWHCSSFFVWKINIQGNSAITTEDILRTLSEVGISVGDRYDRIDYEELEKYLRKKYDTIIWISMKQNGTIIDISLKENQIVPLVENKNENPCNIVASEDGIIHSMVVRKGVPNVSIGAEVKKGDVLVRGEIPIYNDDGTLRNKSFVKADADILIENSMPVHITLPKVYTKREYTGRYKKNFMVITDAGHVIKTSIPVHYLYKDEITDISEQFRLFLWEMPISFERITTREFLNVEYENDFVKASTKMEKEFAYFLANLMEKGVQIISKNVRIEEDYANWVLSGNITVLSQAYIEDQIEEIYE